MREFIIRGKCSDTGKWVYGNLILHDNAIVWFFESEYGCDTTMPFHIIPNTFGQYTGMDDKNGTRIFEGDIVRFHDLIPSFFDEQREFTGTVQYGDNSFIIVCDTSTHYRWIDYEIEVIGNIYDNPELLKTEVQE